MKPLENHILFDVSGLSFYGKLRGDTVFLSAAAFLSAIRKLPRKGDGDAAQPLLAALEAWGSFFSALWEGGRGNWTAHVAAAAMADENPFTLEAEGSSFAALSPGLAAAAQADLDRLGRIARWNPVDAAESLADTLEAAGQAAAAVALRAEAAVLGSLRGSTGKGAAPSADLQDSFLAAAVAGRIRSSGAGLLGLHRAFLWQGSDESAITGLRSPLLPVLNPDPVRQGDLSLYEAQRSVVDANTRRFLEGKAANNLLLYGDRGTGKSATVKAVCNDYADRGLRLVEVRKGDLSAFSAILETLAKRALKFIVFIDDLSFEETDDAFTGLKALLEGGAERRPDNVVVYATTNRRHLVKERFCDRPTSAMAASAAETGDVRAFDTMQEQFSLADRFGITVVFTAPTQDEYLAIAEFLAEKRGLLAAAGTEGSGAREQFRADALRWERWFNGRSPRTAQQFVDWLAGGEGFPWE